MIYTKHTSKLHKLYLVLKRNRARCINKSKDTACCHAEFYKGLIKLIKINIDELSKRFELTEAREKKLRLHLKRAVEKYKHYSKLCEKSNKGRNQ